MGKKQLELNLNKGRHGGRRDKSGRKCIHSTFRGQQLLLKKGIPGRDA
ncbi:MAG TPA: hypothetical protein VNJ08_01745 [Bacteriovoracaceae bacterium]|nr:hypothetical protein [Bacteriovoracaceae bacterium]